MDTSNVFKIWGKRKRILLTNKCEIDLLHVHANAFCSRHSHRNKINKFVVVSGVVAIESEFGTIILHSEEEFEIRPSLIHRFKALVDSDMVELAYVEKGTINPDDIKRISQGGRTINGKEMTLDEMRKKRLLKL